MAPGKGPGQHSQGPGGVKSMVLQRDSAAGGMGKAEW